MNYSNKSSLFRNYGKHFVKCLPHTWCKFFNDGQSFRQWLPILLLAVSFSSHAYAESASASVVKTAALYNFFKFIEWPEVAAKQNSHILCTTKNDKLGDSLAVLQHKSIADKPMSIRRGLSGNALKDCHLVFISASTNADAIIQKLKGLPIVTVSDQPGFIDQGGTINLLQSNNRLTFEINVAVANKNGIYISPRLLKLATRMITEK